MTRSFLCGLFHKLLVSVILYDAQKLCSTVRFDFESLAP